MVFLLSPVKLFLKFPSAKQRKQIATKLKIHTYPPTMNQYSQTKVKHLTLRAFALLSLSFFMISCNSSHRYLQINCRPLKDISQCIAHENLVVDSLQYRDYLLSYSDISNTAIEGLALLEQCYKFDYGLVMIVVIDSVQYEVITIVNPDSVQVDKLIPGKKYQMKIKPYFYQTPNHFASEFQRPIYLDHYVIYPPYLLRWEEKICTANIKDILF